VYVGEKEMYRVALLDISNVSLDALHGDLRVS
jgi:hypothetical protein